MFLIILEGIRIAITMQVTTIISLEKTGIMIAFKPIDC